jgi:LmbE family N-acetylglucosaminyl deacetylase
MDAAGVPMGLIENLDEIGTPDEHVHIELDVSETYDAKLASLNCHATQLPEQSPWRLLDPGVLREILSREAFTQVHPPPDRYQSGTPTEILLRR